MAWHKLIVPLLFFDHSFSIALVSPGSSTTTPSNQMFQDVSSNTCDPSQSGCQASSLLKPSRLSTSRPSSHRRVTEWSSNFKSLSSSWVSVSGSQVIIFVFSSPAPQAVAFIMAFKLWPLHCSNPHTAHYPLVELTVPCMMSCNTIDCS